MALDKKGRGRFRTDPDGPLVGADHRRARARPPSTATASAPGCRWASARSGCAGFRSLPVPPSATSALWNCGSGPTVVVNGVPVRTRLRASPAELFADAPGAGRAAARTGAGRACVAARTRSASEPAGWPCPVAVRLGSSVGEPPGRGGRTSSRRPGHERRIHPVAGARVRRHCARTRTRAGRRRRAAGPSTPVVVDGWQQGWLTDGSDDPVVASLRARTAPTGGGWPSAACCSCCCCAWSLLPAGAGRVATTCRRVAARPDCRPWRCSALGSGGSGCSAAGSGPVCSWQSRLVGGVGRWATARGCSPGWPAGCSWSSLRPRTSCARGARSDGWAGTLALAALPGAGRRCRRAVVVGADRPAEVPQPHGGQLDEPVEHLGGHQRQRQGEQRRSAASAPEQVVAGRSTSRGAARAGGCRRRRRRCARGAAGQGATSRGRTAAPDAAKTPVKHDETGDRGVEQVLGHCLGSGVAATSSVGPATGVAATSRSPRATAQQAAGAGGQRARRRRLSRRGACPVSCRRGPGPAPMPTANQVEERRQPLVDGTVVGARHRGPTGRQPGDAHRTAWPRAGRSTRAGRRRRAGRSPSSMSSGSAT